MGLFDKFKRKKEPKKESKLTEEAPKKDIIFKNELNNISREEAEEKAEKLKEQINSKDFGVKIGGTKIGNEKIEKENPLADKTGVKFKSMEMGLDISGAINEAINDSIIKKYGTDEEKAEMKRRHDAKKNKQKEKNYFYDKFDEASDLFNKQDYENAIPIFREIINKSTIYEFNVSLSYTHLVWSYEFLHEYDKAIDVLNENIEVKKQFNEDYGDLESEIERIEKSKIEYKAGGLKGKGVKLFYEGRYDEAIPYFEKCVDLRYDNGQIYNLLATIHIRNKNFESAKEVLEKGVENVSFESSIHNEHKTGLGDRLVNINNYLETGILVGEQLPTDSLEMKSDIKYAKQVLKEEDKDEGVNLLEILIQEGSYSNTVYYTLYQTYMKDKKYNDAIRISDLAIENLGLFDQDKLEKWTKYKDKAIAKKEKETAK